MQRSNNRSALKLQNYAAAYVQTHPTPLNNADCLIQLQLEMPCPIRTHTLTHTHTLTLSRIIDMQIHPSGPSRPRPPDCGQSDCHSSPPPPSFPRPNPSTLHRCTVHQTASPRWRRSRPRHHACSNSILAGDTAGRVGRESNGSSMWGVSCAALRDDHWVPGSGQKWVCANVRALTSSDNRRRRTRPICPDYTHDRARVARAHRVLQTHAHTHAQTSIPLPETIDK